MSCLGHLIFMFLHLVAIMFGFVLLIVTIPGHLIFAAATQKQR